MLQITSERQRCPDAAFIEYRSTADYRLFLSYVRVWTM